MRKCTPCELGSIPPANKMIDNTGLIFSFFSVGQKVIYKKVREALGFDRTVSFFTGAAPISRDVLKYFLSLDMVILELYGMSECTGPQSMCYHNKYKLGSVGVILPGCENRLSEPDQKGEGEVCMWGRHCMMGYLNR